MASPPENQQQYGRGRFRTSPADRGRLGAQKRWGENPRVVRLDDLSQPQRALVLALISAARNANEKAGLAVVGETGQEVRRAAGDPS